jgi:hypothetical protein
MISPRTRIVVSASAHELVLQPRSALPRGVARRVQLPQPPLHGLPASVAPSLFRNKNRRRTVKSQSKTAGSQGCRAQRTPHLDLALPLQRALGGLPLFLRRPCRGATLLLRRTQHAQRPAPPTPHTHNKTGVGLGDGSAGGIRHKLSVVVAAQVNLKPGARRGKGTTKRPRHQGLTRARAKPHR